MQNLWQAGFEQLDSTFANKTLAPKNLKQEIIILKCSEMNKHFVLWKCYFEGTYLFKIHSLSVHAIP